VRNDPRGDGSNKARFAGSTKDTVKTIAQGGRLIRLARKLMVALWR
jgi:hypothetical protein